MDKNLFALEQLLQDVPDSYLFYRPKSTMQPDAWKSRYGLPNSPCFVRCEQWPCYSFFRKISEVTIKLAQLLLRRFKSCGNFKVSMMLRERRFSAVFLSRTVVAFWDSSATWTPFVANFYDGWPSFSTSRDNLVYDGPLPKTCPCSVTHKAFKGVTQENEFVSSSASHGTPFWAQVSIITPSGMAVQLQVRCQFTLELRVHFQWLALPHPGAHSIILGLPGTFQGCSSTLQHLSTWTSIHVVRLLFLCRAGRHW